MNMVAKTDRGRIRESNQDAYFVGEMPDGTAFAVVCDGMGGAPAAILPAHWRCR